MERSNGIAMIWDFGFIRRIDLKMIFTVLALMGLSLLVISSMTADPVETNSIFLTSFVKSQIEWFLLGWGVFFLLAGFDYNKLREWTWILYLIMVFLLLGLFFTSPIQGVHRWYKIPLLGIYLQPSEYAKLVCVLALGWFLDKKENALNTPFVSLQAVAISLVPFILIFKQPDLGTSLVLYPISLVMFYFSPSFHKTIFKVLLWIGVIGFTAAIILFSGMISHEKMKPFCLHFLKEYQYERLNPDTYHQRASQIAIAAGGVKGSGWKKSEFAGKKWLPAAHTDSVFSAYCEEFGFFGVCFLLFLYFALLYWSFGVAVRAKDNFGRLLAGGIAIYLAMHIIVNIGMMCGCLPITGVPLILLTYGGSSAITTMGALGILQSIYSRRFMF